MIDVVLFALRPELYDYREQAAACPNKVIKLRQVFYGKYYPLVLDAVKVDVAMRIGGFFGPRWKLPMATAFMSLRPYRPRLMPPVTSGQSITSQVYEFPIVKADKADCGRSSSK